MNERTCQSCGVEFVPPRSAGRPRIRCVECSPPVNPFVGDKKCLHCDTLVTGNRIRCTAVACRLISDNLKWQSRPRVPCAGCGEPTGYPLGKVEIAYHPKCLPVVHGTQTAYKTHGCRCDECREWANAGQRKWAAAYKARTGLTYRDRFARTDLVEIVCPWCGKTKLTDQRTKYCSMSCAKRDWGNGGAQSSTSFKRIYPQLCVTCGVCFISRSPHIHNCSPACIERHSQSSSIRIFTPLCIICGRCFCSRWTISTCSPACTAVKKRYDKRQYEQCRRALMRGAFVANVSPRKIFERDGWECQLCGKAIKRDALVPHPLAPTIDHIVPLAAGGTHEPANAQAAHFMCNAMKGAGGGPQQLRLIG